MKKFAAILIVAVMMLSLSSTAFAASYKDIKPEAVKIGVYLEKNFNLLTDEQKAQLDTIKDQIANWQNLTREEKTQVVNDLNELMLAVKKAFFDKRSEYYDFRLKIEPLVAQIRANNYAIEALFRENKSIRKEISQKLEYLGTLDDYTLPAEVTAKLAEIKEHMKAITETRGNIRGVIEGNKMNLIRMDYEKVVANFEAVIDTQETRIEHMTAINTLLGEINALLPEVPAATPEPEATEEPSEAPSVSPSAPPAI